jgi:hypothetical protein
MRKTAREKLQEVLGSPGWWHAETHFELAKRAYALLLLLGAVLVETPSGGGVSDGWAAVTRIQERCNELLLETRAQRLAAIRSGISRDAFETAVEVAKKELTHG